MNLQDQDSPKVQNYQVKGAGGFEFDFHFSLNVIENNVSYKDFFGIKKY